MMRPPPRNLPPASDAWGRDVENRLMELDQRQRQTDQSTTNNNLGLGGSLGQLSNQVQDLTAAQITLTDLVGTQLAARGGSTSASGFSIPESWTTLTTLTIPSNVTWATGAYVSVNGFIRATFNPSVMGDDFYFFIRVTVNGVASGIEVPCAFNAATGQNVASGAQFRTTTNGTTTTIQLQARSMRAAWYPSTGSNSAILEATALYLR